MVPRGLPGRERSVAKLTGVGVGLVLLFAISASAPAVATAAPGTPSIVDTDPDSPAKQNDPSVKGTVGGGDPIQIKLFESSDCTGDPAPTGTVAEFADAGIAVAVPEDTTTVLTAIATDAAGNDSACSSPFAYTEDPTATCDEFASPTGSDIAGNGSIASPYQTPQKLVNSLAVGDTGCFRAGTYSWSENLSVRTAGITLTAYPGEDATLKGRLRIEETADGATIEHLTLDGRNSANNLSPLIYADQVVLRENEITNYHTAICVALDSYFSGPPPQGVVIERNRIHDCGVLPSTNKEHGIYVAEARDTVIRDNWIYDNAGRGIQLYPDAQRSTITGNVIDGNGEGINFAGSGDLASDDNIVQGNVISNSNLRWNAEDGTNGPLPDGNVLRDNCVWASNGNAAYNSNGGIQTPSRNFTVSGNLISAPGFVDAAAGDFHLQWGSACLAKYTGTMSLPVGPPPPPTTLTVQAQGTGTGSVTGPGIACPGDCTETYTNGQQVTLTATPSGGSSLGAWGGACSGTGGSCQLTMSADKQASASFNPPPPPPVSYTLRPNIDLASAWRRIGASSAWAALDDNLLQPTVPNAPDYIQASAKGQVTTVGFATKALNGAVPRGATVFYYGSTYGGDTRLQLDARWGGATRATYTLSTGQAFAWRSLSVSPTNQAAVDDLNLRLTALGGTHTIVTAVYIKLDI
jgi:hypothetical protein